MSLLAWFFSLATWLHASRWQAVAGSLLVASITGCSLPSLEGRSQSQPLPIADALQTPLGKALEPAIAAHPEQSGFYPLDDAHEAFASRALLARAAQHTLDVQYYIWRNDKTGLLQLEELLLAADRGVRVRLLLDDTGTTGMDDELSTLDSHPAIEVRLFNPFVLRSPKMLGYLTDFSRLNRRMHNKSYTADNMVTIIGGRNMADAYFGATDGVLFADLDVMAVGPVVQDLSQDFNAYWDSASAYPVDRLLSKRSSEQLAQTLKNIRSVRTTEASREYLQAIENTALMSKVLDRSLPWEWARVTMVSDNPAKGLGPIAVSGLVLTQLDAAIGEPKERLDVVSPYLVPTASGVEAFGRMRAQGVAVRILTNSFAATDVPIVHAGYAKRRKALLHHGVVLYEMRRQSPLAPVERPSAREWLKNISASDSSLHAKTFAVDGKRVFIGSLNFDPRSALLNTELGFVIESPKLAQQMHQSFDTEVPLTAWHLQLSANAQLQWHSYPPSPLEAPTTEPDTSALSRMVIRILSVLPIEWML